MINHSTFRLHAPSDASSPDHRQDDHDHGLDDLDHDHGMMMIMMVAMIMMVGIMMTKNKGKDTCCITHPLLEIGKRLAYVRLRQIVRL